VYYSAEKQHYNLQNVHLDDLYLLDILHVEQFAKYVNTGGFQDLFDKLGASGSFGGFRQQNELLEGISRKG
jgi:hypothetical protein